jgi:hypothetical protein
MPGEFGSSRFGWDAPARISTSAAMLQEATEVLPGEMLHGPIGFLPSLVNGDGSTTGSSSDSANTQWKAFPDRLDLYWYQGDDVQIPLYFTNPGDPSLDMSNENEWEWKSQMRVRHRFYSYKVNEFTIESAAVPPTPPSVTPTGMTLVTLFLPRQLNQYRGVYSWDLMSTSPFEGPVYPKPPDIELWPPTTQVKTWLWGKIYVVPRVTSTDWLPVPPDAIAPGTVVVVTPQGWTVGPNGRVP